MFNTLLSLYYFTRFAEHLQFFFNPLVPGSLGPNASLDPDTHFNVCGSVTVTLVRGKSVLSILEVPVIFVLFP